MDKKAQEGNSFPKTVRIIILVIVVVVIFRAFFMTFFPRLEAAYMGFFGSSLEGGDGEAIGEDQTGSHMREGIKALVEAAEYARDSPTQGGCMVTPQAGLPEDFQGFSIEIHRLEDGTNYYLVNPSDQKGRPSQVEGIYPCVVFGEQQVKNFYNNWLDDTPANYSSRITPEYQEVGALQIPLSQHLKFHNKLHNRMKLTQLYKADQNHLCFFADVKKLFGGCATKKKALTVGCRTKIKENLPECEPPS